VSQFVVGWGGYRGGRQEFLIYFASHTSVNSTGFSTLSSEVSEVLEKVLFNFQRDV
jgi:hypothetical protein